MRRIAAMGLALPLLSALLAIAQDPVQPPAKPPEPEMKVFHEVRGDNVLNLRAESPQVPEGAVVWFRLIREVNVGSFTEPVLKRGPSELEDTNAGYMRRGRCETRFTVPLAGTYFVKIEVRKDVQPARILRDFQSMDFAFFSIERKIAVGTIADQMSASNIAMSKLEKWMKDIESLVASADDPEIDGAVKARRAVTISGEMRQFERLCGLSGSLKVLDSMATMLYNTFAFTPQLVKGGKGVKDSATASTPAPSGLNNAGNEDPNAKGEQAQTGGGGGGGGPDGTDTARKERLKWAHKQMDKVRRCSARESAMILLERLADAFAGFSPETDAKASEGISKDILQGLNYHDTWFQGTSDTSKLYKSITEEAYDIDKLFTRFRKYLEEGETTAEKNQEFLAQFTTLAATLRARP